MEVKACDTALAGCTDLAWAASQDCLVLGLHLQALLLHYHSREVCRQKRGAQVMETFLRKWLLKIGGCTKH